MSINTDSPLAGGAAVSRGRGQKAYEPEPETGRGGREAEHAAGSGDGPAPAEPTGPGPGVLPKDAVVTIVASRGWGGLDLRELWAYRELLFFMTWRDIKIRYKQTALGVAWVLLLPLMSALIFTIFLGRVARVGSDGLPYTLFAYAGLLPWTLFSTAVGSGSVSLVANAHLISKVYFPRAIIPASAVVARFVDFAVTSSVLVVMMIYYGVAPTAEIFLVPVLLLVLAVFTLGFNMWVSALNVRYRDVGMIIPVLLQLWMFASPVVYPASLVPERWRLLYNLNPMVGIIGNFRAAIHGGAIDWVALGFSTGIAFALLAVAVREFGRMERSFADFI